MSAEAPGAWTALRTWPPRRWLAAAAGATAFLLVVAVPTDLIPNPVFGREIPPPPWAWPALVASSVLGGLLLATYVAGPAADDAPAGRDPAGRGGWGGGLLTYFAVGCPVCNKLVLLALGSAGAVTWFEPVQPALQAVALVLLVWALRIRLRGELACPTDLGPEGRRPEQDLHA